MKGIALGAAVTALGLSLTACGSDEDDKAAKLDDITDAVHAAEDADLQLTDAVNRLVVDCMEEQGFDLHPAWMTESQADIAESDEEEEEFNDEMLVGSEAPDLWEVPTLKDAKEEGFGSNIYLDPDYQDEEDAKGGEEEDPFYEESEDYQKEYEKAQYGEEYYEWENASMEEGDSPASMDEMDPPPLEGGCTGDVSKQVYGDPIVPDKDDEDQEGMGPYYGIDYPEGIADYEAQNKKYNNSTVTDARDALAKCIEKGDYPYFEYSDDWGMGLSNYVDGFYEANGDMGEGETVDEDGETVEAPEYDLPPGAPWKKFEDGFEAEVKFATTVAQCGDDTKFREIAQGEWDKVMEQTALDNEAEIYAWHDDIQAALKKAQDLIKG